MNKKFITEKDLETISNWFDMHFNEIFVDQIITVLKVDKEKSMFYWSISSKSTRLKNVISFPVDLKLYKTKNPYSIDKKLNKNFISLSKNKLEKLHILSSSKSILEDKDPIYNCDIIGIIYWYLARVEEINNSDEKDRYGRFSYLISHSFISNTLNRAVVDEWLCYIAIKIFGNVKYSREYEINITHDIDTLYRYSKSNKFRKYKSYLRDFLRIKNLRFSRKSINIQKIANHLNINSDPFNNLDFLMNLSEKCNLKSTFYFIPTNKRCNKDGDYNILDKEVINNLKKINDRGHFIGIHPGFESNDKQDLAIEDAIYFNAVLKKINIKNIISSRMHLLKWKQPETIYLLQSMGIKYDSTLGFPEKIGFRCGTTYPYKMIDPVEIKIMNLTQFPLHIMDFTLTAHDYMNINDKNILLNEIKNISYTCKKFNGCINLLWHNNNVAWPQEKYIYELVINSLL